MNEEQMRQAYEGWCKQQRRRKSDAAWELWQAAYACGYDSKLRGLDLGDMTEDETSFVTKIALEAVDVLLKVRKGKR